MRRILSGWTRALGIFTLTSRRCLAGRRRGTTAVITSGPCWYSPGSGATLRTCRRRPAQRWSAFNYRLLSTAVPSSGSCAAPVPGGPRGWVVAESIASTRGWVSGWGYSLVISSSPSVLYLPLCFFKELLGRFLGGPEALVQCLSGYPPVEVCVESFCLSELCSPVSGSYFPSQ